MTGFPAALDITRFQGRMAMILSMALVLEMGVQTSFSIEEMTIMIRSIDSMPKMINS